uniref:Sodium/hydrogen exchanger n=1 Tax=Schmidtea mediterranea TaxID=79327 RepID=A0A0H3YEZ1_SCHMD|nr:slc9a-7 [Schmidtea mediterranea]
MTNGTISLVGWHMEEYLQLLLVSAFMLSVAVLKVFYLRLTIVSHHFPESCMLILVGIIFGLIGKFVLQNATKHLFLTPYIFFLILLPPIILESSYCLYTKTFAEVLLIILIFAILGTLFSFLIIGFALYAIKELNGFGYPSINLTLMPILLFSALIVAVDPVAVIAIFQDIGIDMELFFMVFGESLLNDAVTVVLYDIVKAFIQISHANTVDIIIGIISFLTVSVGGLLIGLTFGLLSCVMVHYESHYQYVILIIMSYIAYVVALGIAWSGIISMIGCGIVQARYAFRNMAHDSVAMLRHVTESLASISEAMIFFYLGNSLTQRKLNWHTGFSCWALALCIIARFIVIGILSGFVNYFNINHRYITLTEQFVLFYGGLRGAVSFSLCVLIDSHMVDGKTGEERQANTDMLYTTTMFIILFTVVVMGSTMKPLVKVLQIKLNSKSVDSKIVLVNLTLKAVEFANKTIIILTGHEHHRFLSWFKIIELKYLHPAFGIKEKGFSFLNKLGVPLSEDERLPITDYRPVLLESKGELTSLSSTSLPKVNEYFTSPKSIKIRKPREFAQLAKNQHSTYQRNRSKVLQSLSIHPTARNSVAVSQFLKMHKHVPERINEFGQNTISEITLSHHKTEDTLFTDDITLN